MAEQAMEFVGKRIEAGFQPPDAMQQAVIADDRRDRCKQADGGGEQRFGNAGCDDREAGVLRARDGGKRSHDAPRSEEHTSELQSLMRISYAVFCLQKKKKHTNTN